MGGGRGEGEGIYYCRVKIGLRAGLLSSQFIPCGAVSFSCPMMKGEGRRQRGRGGRGREGEERVGETVSLLIDSICIYALQHHT